MMTTCDCANFLPLLDFFSSFRFVFPSRAACVWFAMSCVACRSMTMECLVLLLVYMNARLRGLVNTLRPYHVNDYYFLYMSNFER